MNDLKNFTHPFFGTLTFEETVRWYVGVMDYTGVPLKINFVLKDRALLDDQLSRAQTFLEGETFAHTVLAVADALLAIKNDMWLNEDEVPFTKEELLDFLDIDAIVFYADNHIDIYSFESDLFWGNRAISRVDYAGKMMSTHIEEDIMDEE